MFFKNNNKIAKIFTIGIFFIGIINLMIIPVSVNAFNPSEVFNQLMQHSELTDLIGAGGSDADIISLIQTIAPNLLPPQIQIILQMIRLIHPLSPSQQFMQDIQTQEFKTPTLNQYKWEVGIPGLVKAGDTLPLEEEGVSSLIKIIIWWVFRLAGILAFAMIIFAGFQYLTSGGNTAQQKDAQEKITGAIIGLILLFAFYIILYTINPDILKISLFISPGALL